MKKYPSQSICEELTRKWFPLTEKLKLLNTIWFQARQSLRIPINFWVCPSIEELDNETIGYVVRRKKYDLVHDKMHTMYICKEDGDIAFKTRWAFVDRLARAWIWTKDELFRD